MKMTSKVLLALMLVSPAFAAGSQEDSAAANTAKNDSSYSADVSTPAASSSYATDESSATTKSKNGAGDSKSNTDSSTDSKQQNQVQ